MTQINQTEVILICIPEITVKKRRRSNEDLVPENIITNPTLSKSKNKLSVGVVLHITKNRLSVFNRQLKRKK